MRTQRLCQLKWEKEVEQREKDAMLCQLKWERETEQREKDAMLCQLKWERVAEEREKDAMLCQLKWGREAEQREKDAAEQAKLLTEVIRQNKDKQQRVQERAEKYEHEKEERQAEMKKKTGDALAARNERKSFVLRLRKKTFTVWKRLIGNAPLPASNCRSGTTRRMQNPT